MSYNTELIKKIEIYIEENGISKTKLAKLLNIGGSTLSEWMNQKYKGNIVEIEHIISEFLERKKSAVIRRIDFVADTFNKIKVFDAIDTVQDYIASANQQGITESCKIGIVYGRAGLGKTKAVQEYVKQAANCKLITAQTGDNEKSILEKICISAGIDTRGTSTAMKRNILNALKGREIILIIDESEHLRPKTIDIVRSIGDVTGVGIILVGTETLRDKLKSTKNEYEYLYSRVVVASQVKELSFDDVKLITKTYLEGEEHEYKESEIDELSKALKALCNGSARILSNLLTMSMKLCKMEKNLKISGGKLIPPFVEAAQQKVIIHL